MFIVFYPSDFVLIVPINQEHRLCTTCFRPAEQRAGNFITWRNCYEALFKDLHLRRELEKEIKLTIKEMERKGEEKVQWAFTFSHPQFIGWTSTVPLTELPSGIKLEEFSPNPHTRALAVVSNETIPAPLTKKVTVICLIRRSEEKNVAWAVVVYSLYPGEEVELGHKKMPRTIAPEEAVFFRFDHPGAPIS